MKIFLSWSGQLSHSIALLLKDWLPSVLQYVEEPFVSSKDIEKGSAWFGDISKKLNDAEFGIICLTSDNLNSPWIHFEAGAIANKFQGARIPGLIVNVQPSDVKPPLSQFQLTTVNKDDMLLLVKTINTQAGANGLSDGKLTTAFNKWWMDFETRFADELKSAPRVPVKATIRPPEEILSEILTNTRNCLDRLAMIKRNEELLLTFSGARKESEDKAKYWTEKESRRWNLDKEDQRTEEKP
jgi:hypothetical protein